MKGIPQEWIDRLFDCMALFYGKRWTSQFQNAYHKELHKTIWKSGLIGLNYDQIKKELYYRRKEALKTSIFPPRVVEFYDHASAFLTST